MATPHRLRHHVGALWASRVPRRSIPSSSTRLLVTCHSTTQRAVPDHKDRYSPRATRSKRGRSPVRQCVVRRWDVLKDRRPDLADRRRLSRHRRSSFAVGAGPLRTALARLMSCLDRTRGEPRTGADRGATCRAALPGRTRHQASRRRIGSHSGHIGSSRAWPARPAGGGEVACLEGFLPGGPSTATTTPATPPDTARNATSTTTPRFRQPGDLRPERGATRATSERTSRSSTHEGGGDDQHGALRGHVHPRRARPAAGQLPAAHGQLPLPAADDGQAVHGKRVATPAELRSQPRCHVC